jgi:hypothetical protein
MPREMSEQQELNGWNEPEAATPARGASEPLGYESPHDRLQRDPPVNVLAMTFAFAAGFVMSAGGGLFAGIFVYLFADSTGHDNLGFRLLACVYVLCLFPIGIGIARAFRRPGIKTGERWFWLGVLFGLGISCLLEGCCFGFSAPLRLD